MEVVCTVMASGQANEDQEGEHVIYSNDRRHFPKKPNNVALLFVCRCVLPLFGSLSYGICSIGMAGSQRLALEYGLFAIQQ